MLDISHKFIYQFLIFFLLVLLAMFGMYYGLVQYMNYVDRANPAVFIDAGRLFKVNLFMVDLCVLVIAESLLILLFCTYTLSSIGVSTVVVVMLLWLKEFSFSSSVITRIFSPFVANNYAFLDTCDAVVLILLNTLLLCFLITVLLKEGELEGIAALKRTRTIQEPEGTVEKDEAKD